MTVIAGIVHDGRVHLAGDSAAVGDGYSLVVRADTKIFNNGPYVVGFTSSFRMGQLLRYAAIPEPEIGLDRFMVTNFVDTIRTAFRTGGFLYKDGEQESGGSFLVGVRGRLFEIDSDFQVGESLDGYAAVGCGAQIALGALYATATGRPRQPETRLRTAMHAAERFSAGVRGPFAYLVGGTAQ